MPWISRQRLNELEARPSAAVRERDKEVTDAFKALWPKHERALRHAAGVPMHDYATGGYVGSFAYVYESIVAPNQTRMIDTLIEIADAERARIEAEQQAETEARQQETDERRKTNRAANLRAGKVPEPEPDWARIMRSAVI